MESYLYIMDDRDDMKQNKQKEVLLRALNMNIERYEKAFNFFQSKSINLILSNRKNQHVIHFRDMEFFDDDVEYLKRYYTANQSIVRVQKLISILV